jgi:DNA-directed RNA polymerase subunit M/transcription elongation factor TFIIS
LKGKCIAQPSQGNRDDMVKKLETGTTVACTRSLEEKVKNLRNVKREKINTSTKSLNHASIQGNIQGNDQATLHTKKNKKCSECFEKGHLIRSCPYVK